jgi:hypothetical protein
MIRMVGRCLAILLVACLMALAIYSSVQNNLAIVRTGAALGEGRRGGFAGGGETGGLGLQQRPSGEEPPTSLGEFSRPDRGYDSEGGAGDLAGVAGILRNIVVIAGITVAVVAIQKVLSVISRRRKAQLA